MAKDDDPPTPEEAEETVARLGIDVGQWAAEIRARVAAAFSPSGVCPDCQGRFPHDEVCSRCGGSGSVPLGSIPDEQRSEGYYWVRRGDVPEVAFWSVRGCWQFVWSDRDWATEGIEVLSERLQPPS